MNTSLRIRVATEDDAAQIRAIYAPYIEQNSVSFEVDVPSVETMRARIAKLLPTHPWLVCVDGDDRIAGYVYAGPHRERAAYRWSVEVAAYLHADFHRRGIGKRLYTALAALLRRQGYVNAFGIITLPNAASVALHEACGFKAAALYSHAGYKFGQWHDVGWWQLTIQKPVVPPQEPTAFAQIDPQPSLDHA